MAKNKEEVESPFMQDENGDWILNPKARVTSVELMVLESIRRSQDRGEPVDPVDMLSQATEKIRVYQEAGARPLPNWMTNPTKFIETMRRILG